MESYRWWALLPLVLVSACGGGDGGGLAGVTADAPAGMAAPADGSAPVGPLARPDDKAGPEPADAPGDPAAVGAGDYELAGYGGLPVGQPAQASDATPKEIHASAPMTEATAMTAYVGAGRRTLYVSPNGADGNPGTAAQPFRSLARAARAVTAGTTVIVAPGTYSGGFRTNASGQANARIAFVSSQKWGAKIVPPANSPNRIAWDNRGSHVDIVGFDIDGSVHRSGVRWSHGIYSAGSYDTIRNNRIAHIAQSIACTSAGGAAIGVDSYYKGVQADITANLVHDIGPAGCRFVQGIYVSTSGRVRNNVVYRVAACGIHLWHDARNVIITNNTVTTSGTGIVVGGGDFYFAKGPSDNTAVYSNIVVDNKMGISEQGQTGLNNTYRNNLVYRNTTYNWRLKNNLRHTATVTADPRFVVDSLVNPGYRLSSASPAIGRATAELADSSDFEGKPRNAQSGYDIGAFQH